MRGVFGMKSNISLHPHMRLGRVYCNELCHLISCVNHDKEILFTDSSLD